MHLTHIVAATDESDAGRQAVWAAIEMAGRVGACVTVLRVVPSDGNGTHPDLERLQRCVESDLPPLDSAAPITYAVAQGLPGIEIVRFAERSRASLLVLGRTPRSRIVRLLLGDTADAVARRSGVPCLFVSPQGTRPRRLLVAVDGSVRGMTVLDTADRFARQVGADLLVLTVEPTHVGEPAHLALATPLARSTRIRSQVHDTLGHEIEVRRGEAAEQILAAVDERRPDVVVLGCHRGGPAGVIEAGSTARQVIHAARCAVLTVPL